LRLSLVDNDDMFANTLVSALRGARYEIDRVVNQVAAERYLRLRPGYLVRPHAGVEQRKARIPRDAQGFASHRDHGLPRSLRAAKASVPNGPFRRCHHTRWGTGCRSCDSSLRDRNADCGIAVTLGDEVIQQFMQYDKPFKVCRRQK